MIPGFMSVMAAASAVVAATPHRYWRGPITDSAEHTKFIIVGEIEFPLINGLADDILK